MTTQSHDRLRILDRLDANGRCRALEVLGKLDHALADARIALVAGAALHERRVDLELRERQIAQRRKGRVAASEIVDRERNSILPQPLEVIAYGDDLVEQLRFRHLDDQS